MITEQLQKDLKYTYDRLSDTEREKLSGSTVLITGSAGFIGFYLVHFLYFFRDELRLKKVICLDNFMLGEPGWQKEIAGDERFVVKKYNVISDRLEDIPEAAEADFVVHMASIASPTFYRLHPIETIDANIWGLRRLFDFYKEKNLQGFLFSRRASSMAIRRRKQCRPTRNTTETSARRGRGRAMTSPSVLARRCAVFSRRNIKCRSASHGRSTITGRA